MHVRGRFLLLISLAWAAWAPAAGARPRDLTLGALEEGTAVRMVAPQAGTTLVADTTAEVGWEPLDRFAELLPRTEEWEAFLSLDDGKTYPMRITPHLDADLRRFRWQVPPLPTPHARILLRFGDERKETSVLVPRRFAIVAAPAGSPAAALASPWGPELSPLVRRAPKPGATSPRASPESWPGSRARAAAAACAMWSWRSRRAMLTPASSCPAGPWRRRRRPSGPSPPTRSPCCAARRPRSCPTAAGRPLHGPGRSPRCPPRSSS